MSWRDNIIADDEVITGNRLYAAAQGTSTVFCKSDKLKDFKGTSLKNFITHNSDHLLLDRDAGDCRSIGVKDGPNLSGRWFAQNNASTNPKVISLPIGLTNFTAENSPHCELSAPGNLAETQKVFDLFCAQKNKREEAESLVLMNFTQGQRGSERFNIYNCLKSKEWISAHDHLPHKYFYEKLAKSKFCISPAGNGIDCHRHWEALYLGCIPIVKKHAALQQFDDLPFLFVEEWHQLSEAWLKQKYEEFCARSFNISKLTVGFWRELFNE